MLFSFNISCGNQIGFRQERRVRMRSEIQPALIGILTGHAGSVPPADSCLVNPDASTRLARNLRHALRPRSFEHRKRGLSGHLRSLQGLELPRRVRDECLAAATSYRSPAAFTGAFLAKFGAAPSQWRRAIA